MESLCICPENTGSFWIVKDEFCYVSFEEREVGWRIDVITAFHMSRQSVALVTSEI